MRAKATLTAAASALLLAAGAWGAHPEPYRAKDIRLLAHELEDAARAVHRAAERAAHHADRREARALVALHELEDEARRFHRRVEIPRWLPYRSRADFGALERAYFRAARDMHDLHAFEPVNRQFFRVTDAFYELAYAVDGVRYRRHRGRGVHYRDRDWDSDSDSDSYRGRRHARPGLRVDGEWWLRW